MKKKDILVMLSKLVLDINGAEDFYLPLWVEGGSSHFRNYYRCPICKIALKFRSRENRVEKTKYFRYEVYCPTCQEITCINNGCHRVSTIHLGRSFGRHAGDIGEKCAMNFLIDAGFEVLDFGKLVYYVFGRGDKIMNRGKAKLFLGKKYSGFRKFCREWNKCADKISGGSTIRPIPIPNEDDVFYQRSIGLDWVAKRDNKLYLVEVKTNRAKLTIFQKKMLLKSKELGFIPILLKLIVKIDVPTDKIQMQCL